MLIVFLTHTVIIYLYILGIRNKTLIHSLYRNKQIGGWKMKRKEQNAKKRNYLSKIGALSMAMILTFTGVSVGMSTISVNADTSQNSVRTVSWYGLDYDSAQVDSVSYLQNVNMHSGISDLTINDSFLNYGPLQNTARYAYVKFDLTAADEYGTKLAGDLKGVKVNYAYLMLKENSDSSIPGTILVKSPVKDWDSLTLTYANQPELLEKAWGSCICTGVKDTIYSLNVTEWAQNIADGTTQNYGFVLYQQDKKTSDSFYGAASGKYYPQLVINYDVNE